MAEEPPLVFNVGLSITLPEPSQWAKDYGIRGRKAIQEDVAGYLVNELGNVSRALTDNGVTIDLVSTAAPRKVRKAPDFEIPPGGLPAFFFMPGGLALVSDGGAGFQLRRLTINSYGIQIDSESVTDENLDMRKKPTPASIFEHVANIKARLKAELIKIKEEGE